MRGISIIVCTHNGSGRMKPVLEALFQLEKPAGLETEIIIVDNASTDGTGTFCISVVNGEKYTGTVTVITEVRPGLNFARLKGINTASFDWILFCDDDNELFPDYLVQAVRILKQQPTAGALGGCGIPRFESVPPEWFERYSHSYAVGPQAEKDGLLVERPSELYGAGCLFYKPALLHWFEKGFTTVLTDRKGKELVSGGDVEWCYLVQLAGYSLVYDSGLRFYHCISADRLQWPYYLRLKAGIAAGCARLIAYHAFFKVAKPSVFTFTSLYVIGLLKTTLIWLLFVLKRLFVPGAYKPETGAIGEVVLLSRMKAFWKDSWIAFHHFRQLKQFQ
ncbi:MAG TPA: glycosyltransferase [Saprospiraceae bacterium]|nr:glycosyltransferase [Saprospiraceae bacterium]